MSNNMKPLKDKEALQAIEKVTILAYFENLLEAKSHKITLFSIFPHTAAANLSDPRHLVILDDVSRFTKLDRGNAKN